MKTIIAASLLIFFNTAGYAQNCGPPPNQNPDYANAGAETRSFIVENYYRCLERSRQQQNHEAMLRQQQQNQYQMQQPIQIQPPAVFDRWRQAPDRDLGKMLSK
jgi:hypothetical protein